MNCNNVIKTYKACTCTPAVGQIVIAKHWNGNWYRAKVISFLETSESQNTFEVVKNEIPVMYFKKAFSFN